MSNASNQRPAYYARMICDHMKSLPDFYAPSLDGVKEALGISDSAFMMGLNWCIDRKIIVMEAKPKVAVATITDDVEHEALKGESTRLSSMLRAPALAEAS